MNTNYYILKNINDDCYSQISIGIDMSRLEDYINYLENDLRCIEYKGKILFDLLLSNDCSDRFYECYFDGNNFQFNSLEKVNNNNVSVYIKRVTSSFYEHNIDLFDEDIYTDEYREYVLKTIKSF